jgi:hypothetical protein
MRKSGNSKNSKPFDRRNPSSAKNAEDGHPQVRFLIGLALVAKKTKRPPHREKEPESSVTVSVWTSWGIRCDRRE